MWWLCSVPVLLYPRSGPLWSCRPLGCCGLRTPHQWCSCSPGWTHSEWNGTTGYSSPHQSLQWAPLEKHKKTSECLNKTAALIKNHIHREDIIAITARNEGHRKKQSIMWVLESKPQTKVCIQSVNTMSSLKSRNTRLVSHPGYVYMTRP